MTTLEEKLQQWIITETSFLAEKSLTNVLDVSTLSLLTEGKNKKIWEYIVAHVRPKCTVSKVKRILKLRRDQKNPEKLFPKPLKDLSKLHQEIANAEDKQKFLKNSLSNVKKEIMLADESLSKMHDEIDKINQKTSILHLLSLHYQEKTALLNSLHGCLSLHLTVRGYKQNAKIQTLNIEASLKKGYSTTLDEINPKIKHLLEQSEALVIKKFKNSPGVTSLVSNLQKTVTEAFKGVLVYNLLFILKEQCKISSVDMLKRLSQDQGTFLKSSKGSSKRDSEKLLEELKFNHISINFSVKKVKNDICRLMSDKGALLMSKVNPFSEDKEYQAKCLLLDKIVENKGLKESISYLEKVLYDKQNKLNTLKKMNAIDVILNEDIVSMQNKFFSNFDILCLLLNSVPSMLDYIAQRFVDINKYSKEDLYLTMSSALQEFPTELENEIKFESDALWNVIKRNDIIKPLLQGNKMLDHFTPEAFWNLVDIAPFHNPIEICRNVKLFKDYILASKKDNWDYDEKRLSNACNQYDKMMNTLQKMENLLVVCQGNLDDALSYRGRVQTALQDWWEQGAQFIPDIVYDNKTLKMWIDIVNAADGIV